MGARKRPHVASKRKRCHSVGEDWSFRTKRGIGSWTRGKEESKLRFEVNGQMFFVNFIPEEGRWYCFAPTATGLQKIPVSIDVSPFEAYTVELDEQAKEVVN